jgi:hypothetical protein
MIGKILPRVKKAFFADYPLDYTLLTNGICVSKLI